MAFRSRVGNHCSFPQCQSVVRVRVLWFSALHQSCGMLLPFFCATGEHEELLSWTSQYCLLCGGICFCHSFLQWSQTIFATSKDAFRTSKAPTTSHGSTWRSSAPGTLRPPGSLHFAYCSNRHVSHRVFYALNFMSRLRYHFCHSICSM